MQTNPDPTPLSALLALLVPIVALLLVAARGGFAPMLRWLRAQPPTRRALALLATAVLIGYGGEKPQPHRMLELLTVLRDGTITDISGTVASGIRERAIARFNEESQLIADSASNTVTEARQQLDGLTNTLLQLDYASAYIGYDFPRGTSALQNHNLLVTIERTAQTNGTLSAWAWFSQEPSTNVALNIAYSVAPDRWLELAPTATSWPLQEPIGDVQCYRYDYTIPPAIAGVPLKPQYEVEFGGIDLDQYLRVPADGIFVETDLETCQPYTGWDVYRSGDPDELAIRYQGGVAIEARQYGQTYKGTR